MGKKGKVGKQRKDRYYHLAKETGYRSRAAFKLIQLNRKFEFLQKSKVLIDLCAAPGGWLQVAQKYMPVSSIIVGVDLVPIKPIYNVITLQEDITTQKCRTLLTKELKTWKVDVVLNDGAPNVGRSWIHDAFEQNRLTLSALHLACDFLMKGGWFVTKVFRSKDYNALMWVFKKLFKRVHATKPQASRNESAEIFVVCQHFISPDKIDPRFFDPSYVFADVEQKVQRMNKGDLLKPIAKQKRAKAEGYADGDLVLHYKINASEFVRSINYIELLSKTSEIILDSDDIKNNPLTTEDIVESLKDLKVLGRKELITLITWRHKIRHVLFPKKTENNDEDEKVNEVGEVAEEVIEENDPEQSEEAQKLKRKKRKIAKEKKKIEERMSLKMVLKNDQLVEEEQELFDLKHIKKNSQLNSFNQDTEPNDIGDSDEEQRQPKISKVLYDKEDSGAKYYDPDDSDNEEGFSGDENYENAEDLVEITNDDLEEYDNDNNCLVVDLEDKNDKLKNLTKMFFDNKIFNKDSGDDLIDDEDIELKELENRITKVKNTEMPNEKKADKNVLESRSHEENLDLEDSDSDSNDENEKTPTNGSAMLSSEEMALASVMIKSKKNKRDVMNDAWNRYNHEDDNFLPSWFKKEEQVYYRKPIVVSNELAKDYNDRLKEINSRPIKKVMEAKARKKKRAIRRLEKARTKAETVTDNDDMTNTEKAGYIRSIYKKAVKNDKNKVQLVVGKKMYGNRRPPGVRGRYKVVDSRLKKDKRGESKQQSKKQKGNNKTKRPKQGKARK